MKNALDAPVKEKAKYASLNYLFAKVQLDENKYKKSISDLSFNLSLLAKKDIIYRKYYRYKLLSKILFGKKRKHYKQKRIEQKLLVSKIRELENIK